MRHSVPRHKSPAKHPNPKGQPKVSYKLPSELLVKVFTCIDSHSLLFYVALVCKRWRALALDTSLWRTRTLRQEDFIGRNLSLLALAPALHEVNLHTSSSPHSVMKALVHGKKNLKNLTIHFQDGCFNAEQLQILLPHFPNLQFLKLQLPAATHDQAIFSAFHPLQNLCSLELSGIISPVSELIYALTTFCVSLHTLHLVNCLISFRDDHLLTLITDGRPWHSLKLVTYFLSEEAYTFFSLCHQLHELALIKCKSLTEEQLLKIASLPKLHSITLSENCILSPAALTAFFRCPSMKNLSNVDLTVYRADDQVAHAIATNCPQLVRLRFAMCLLSDEGVRSIILNSPQLTELDFEFNNIRGLWLHFIPTHIPTLTQLNLHLCYNVLISLTELVAQLPTLTVIDPTGVAIAGTHAKLSHSKLQKFKF